MPGRDVPRTDGVAPAAGVARAAGPLLAIAVIAALVAGLVEGAAFTSTVLATAAAAGFSSLWVAPIAFAVLVVGRVLWRAWRMPALFAAAADDGGSPLFAAWIVYIGLSLAALSAVSSLAVGLATKGLRFTSMVAMATSATVVGAALVLLIASRPVTHGLAWLLGRVDRRLRRRRSLFTPWRLFGATVTITAAALALVWFVVVLPRIGTLELVGGVYAVVFVAVALATAIGWTRLDVRARRGVLAAALAAWLALIGTGVFTRYQRPFTLLDAWGDAPVAGLAIYSTFDFNAVRRDFSLAEVKPVARPGAAHPDIVLITIDTLRADHTPVYGGAAEMPALATLARRAAVLDWAFSPGNTTRRSLPSLATGLSPRRIRGRVAGWALRMDPRHVTFAERLRAGGYDTVGFFCCGAQFDPQHRLGLDRGIDKVHLELAGDKLVAQALAWLDARARVPAARRPLFLWVHVFEPHTWDQTYPAMQYGAAMGPRYDRMLADTDRILKPLLDRFGDPSRAASTVLVVTADHGEGLGDHGEIAHSSNLYNEQIHVPLLVAAPGLPARHIVGPVALTGLAATLLDLAGFVPPVLPVMDGASLAPLLRGEVQPGLDGGHAYASMVADRSVASSMDAVVVGRHKLILGPNDRVQIYDVVADPGERRNLLATEPALLAPLLKAMAERRRIDRLSPFQ